MIGTNPEEKSADKERILLAAINSAEVGPSPFFINLFHFFENKTHNYLIESKDFFIKRDDLYTIFLELICSRPNYIILTVHSWNFTYVQNLVSNILTHTSINLLIGGPYSIYFENLVSDRLNVFSSDVDKGEKTVLKFFNLWENYNEEFYAGNVPTYYRNGFLDSYPFRTIILYEVSRGCLNKCKFCIESQKAFWAKSIDTIKKEIDYIILLGFKKIDILDNNANSDIKYLLLYYRYILDNPDIYFHLEMSPRHISSTRKILKQFLLLDNVQVYFGVQSLNNQVLKKSERNNDYIFLENILKYNHSLIMRKLFIGVDLIFGLPKQTFDLFFDDFVNLCKVLPDKIILNHYQFNPISEREITDIKILAPSLNNRILENEYIKKDDVCSFYILRKSFGTIQNYGYLSILINFLLIKNNIDLKSFYRKVMEFYGPPLNNSISFFPFINKILEIFLPRTDFIKYMKIFSKISKHRDMFDSIIFDYPSRNIINLMIKYKLIQ